MSFFDSAFELIVGIEGSLTNDPQDPGGLTKYGISQRSHPDLDIANLTLDQAKALYRAEYWDVCACDLLPWERALCVFDTAVNQGPGAARSLNVQSHDAVALMTERALRYIENPHFERFGKGWLTRLFTVFKAAQVTPP